MSLYLCTTSLYLCTASLYLEKLVASKQLKFAIETDVERKARREKMVATTQLRLALETEEERGAKKGMNLFRFDIKKKFFSRNELARPVMGTIFLVIVSDSFDKLANLNNTKTKFYIVAHFGVKEIQQN